MAQDRVGILHPGVMGVSVAATARNSGSEVYWASEGRSAHTHLRASQANLKDAGTVAELCRTCSIILSICPPHAAEEVARQVCDHAFAGLYVDANAISPQRVIRISQQMGRAAIAFVDGGIIGGPAWEPGQTWLYLSGERARDVAQIFTAGPLATAIIGSEIGKASALKMCYAAYTKGSTALLCAILAAADSLGVWSELQQQWARDWPGFDEQAVDRVQRVASKAWRYAGEMEEIASTFRAASLPGGFHESAAQLYRYIAHFKDGPSPAPLQQVLEALRAGQAALSPQPHQGAALLGAKETPHVPDAGGTVVPG